MQSDEYSCTKSTSLLVFRSDSSCGTCLFAANSIFGNFQKRPYLAQYAYYIYICYYMYRNQFESPCRFSRHDT